MGQGKEMRRVPCTPATPTPYVPHGTEVPLPPIGRGRHLLGPGRIRLPGGQGDPVQGGVDVGVAQLVAGRLGHHHLARHMAPGGAGLAASRTSRVLRLLTAHTAVLAWRPSTAGACGLVATGAFGGLSVLLGQSGRGLYLRLVWCRISGDQAVNGTCRCGEVCQAPIEKGGVDTRQCKSKRSKLDEIHRNSYEIRTKLVRISYEFHISRIFKQIYSREIRAKFVRNSYEIRTNFT